MIDCTLHVTSCSCRCGGEYAVLLVLPSGAEYMLGCICHTNLPNALQRAIADRKGDYGIKSQA